MSQQPTVKGTLKRFSCPWCGHEDSFDEGYAGVEVEHYNVEVGATFKCECSETCPAGRANQQGKELPSHQKGCGRFFEIVRIEPITVIWLRRFQGQPRGF